MSDAQFWNTPSPNVASIVQGERSAVASNEQPLKALLPIVVRFGKFANGNDVIDEQLMKAPGWRLETGLFSGTVKVTSDVQPLKAFQPIALQPVPMTNSCSFTQDLKAFSPTEAVASERTTRSRFIQPSNPDLPLIC